MATPVRFVDSPVTCPAGHGCFCGDDTKTEGFIAHENVTDLAGRITHDGTAHPIHKSCAQAWLMRSSTCPTCRIPISNTSALITRSAAIQHAFSSVDCNLLFAERQMATPMIMGAATIALIAAVEFFGLSGAKDILAIGGGAYSMGALFFGALYGTVGLSHLTAEKTLSFAAKGFAAGAIFGNILHNLDMTSHSLLEVTTAFGGSAAVIGMLLSPFIGGGNRADAGAENRVLETSRISAMTALLIGTGAWFFGKTQDSTVAQIAGIIAVAKSTGLIPLTTGAAIGLGASQVISMSGWVSQRFSEIATTGLSSATTAIALYAKEYTTCPPPHAAGITSMTTHFGMTCGKMLGKIIQSHVTHTLGLVAIGMAAGLASAAATTLVHRAYRFYELSRARAAAA